MLVLSIVTHDDLDTALALDDFIDTWSKTLMHTNVVAQEWLVTLLAVNPHVVCFESRPH